MSGVGEGGGEERARAARRLFVALSPGPELAARVAAAARERLAGAGRALRLVREDELHLTLLFLGDVELEPAGRLAAALEERAGGLGAPELVLGAGGCFPGRGRPRVWWIALAERAGAEERLAALREAALAAARDAGLAAAVEEEAARAFRPHLTVARTRAGRRPPGRAVEAGFRGLALDLPWRPSELILFESHLDRKSGRHEALRRIPLAG